MKIFVLSLLLIAAVFGLTLLTGCDEGMQMMKPAMEKPMPPEMEPEPSITEVPKEPEQPVVVVPEPGVPEEPEQPVVDFPAKLPEEVTEPFSEEEAHNMARKIAFDTIGLMELTERVPQYRFGEYISEEGERILGETISEEAERILIEGTGLTWEQLRSYTYQCLGESGLAEHVEKDRRFIAYIDVLVNYLELFLLYPNNDDNTYGLLLASFCVEGKVAVEAIQVIEKYYPPDHVDDLIEDWKDFLREDSEEPTENEGEDAAGE